jgi:hypothetical protein
LDLTPVLRARFDREKMGMEIAIAIPYPNGGHKLTSVLSLQGRGSSASKQALEHNYLSFISRTISAAP